jgi:hypothetical protein
MRPSALLIAVAASLLSPLGLSAQQLVGQCFRLDLTEASWRGTDTIPAPPEWPRQPSEEDLRRGLGSLIRLDEHRAAPIGRNDGTDGVFDVEAGESYGFSRWRIEGPRLVLTWGQWSEHTSTTLRRGTDGVWRGTAEVVTDERFESGGSWRSDATLTPWSCDLDALTARKES